MVTKRPKDDNYSYSDEDDKTSANSDNATNNQAPQRVARSASKFMPKPLPKFRLKKGFPTSKYREDITNDIIDTAEAQAEKLRGFSNTKLYKQNMPIRTYESMISTSTQRKTFLEYVDKEYNDKKVFPKYLMALFGIVVVFLIAASGVGFYYNSSNPLIRLVDSVKQDYSINVIDRNGIKVFSLVSKSLIGAQDEEAKKAVENNGLVSNVVPETLLNSLIALHGILEDNKAYTPADPSKASSGFLERENLSFLKNISNSRPCSKALSDKDKFYTDTCSYSHYNFLIQYLMPNYTISDYDVLETFVNRVVHTSLPLSEKLLSTWRTNYLTVDDFLEIYFNRLYYGGSILNLQFASKGLFNVDNVFNLTTAQSIILIKELYTNNKNIYPNLEVSHKDILDRLVAQGLVDRANYDAELAYLTNPELNTVMNAYIIYLNNLIEDGYKESLNSQQANVYTSFDGPLINNSINILMTQLRKANIPNASLLISKNNEIYASYTMGILDAADEKGKIITFPTFYSIFPDILMYQSLKPFLYTAMRNSSISIPTLLLTQKYQNLIFAYRLGRKSYAKNDYSGTTTLTPDALAALSSENFDLIPNELKVIFSKQLADTEYDFIKFIGAERFNETLRGFFGQDDKPHSSLEIANGLYSNNFYKAHLAYSALFHEGTVYDTKYFFGINSDLSATSAAVPILSQAQNSLIDDLKTTFFRTIDSLNYKAYYVLDYNVAFVYVEPLDFTISIWLGDMDNTTKRSDYVAILNKFIADIVEVLPTQNNAD